MSFKRSPTIWTDDMMDGYPLSPPPEMGPPWSVQQSFNEEPQSLNDPSSNSSATKDDAIGGGPRVVTAVIGVMILLGIIVMAVVAITLASGSSSNVKTTWSDEQPDITEKNVRGGSAMTVIVPEFRVPSTPPPLRTKSTTQESTKKETTEETTEEDTRSTTTELPTTRAKKDTWAGLICTIGTKLSAPEILPADSSYKFDLNSAAESIEKLIARGMDAVWALSVTIKGRWTKLKVGEPVDFLSECEHDPSAESFGRYVVACEDPSFSYKNDSKSEVVGALYYNKMDRRILSFDNNTKPGPQGYRAPFTVAEIIAA
ncbi:hypothetical protein MTO96_017648 [Rhipicephalus appendiculatus]